MGTQGHAMVCVAAVATAHGVRGALKLRCFTAEPESVAAYGPLCDEEGRELFAVEIVGRSKGGVIVEAQGIEGRDAALALRGKRLYVPRNRLPETDEDEYYHADLIGLEVVDTAGRRLGSVVAVHDFGAGDLLEYADANGAGGMVPFTREAVLEVDPVERRLVVATEDAAVASSAEEVR